MSLKPKLPRTVDTGDLSPAKNLTVLITDPKKNEAIVVCDDENFSLAIGKKGINAKLASRLTRYKLDIKRASEVKDLGIKIK